MGRPGWAETLSNGGWFERLAENFLEPERLPVPIGG